MTRAKSYLSLLRPYQWAKNAFVFVGMAYAHLWADTRLLKLSIAAFVAFCLAASGSYVVNDLADRDRDRKHPLKKSRPIASGAVSAEQARLLAFLLWLAAFAISWWASPRVFFFVAGYAALNVLYSHQLKKVVIIDVFAISAGFMARILAGTLGIGIKPSH